MNWGGGLRPGGGLTPGEAGNGYNDVQRWRPGGYRRFRRVCCGHIPRSSFSITTYKFPAGSQSREGAPLVAGSPPKPPSSGRAKAEEYHS